MNAVVKLSREDETKAITILQNGGLLNKEELKYRSAFYSLGFNTIVSRTNAASYYLVGTGTDSNWQLSKLRSNCLREELNKRQLSLSDDVIASMCNVDWVLVRCYMRELLTILSSPVLLKYFTKCPTTAEQLDDWKRDCTINGIWFLLHRNYECEDATLRNLITLVHSILVEQKFTIGDTRYPAKSQYLMCNHPKLETGDLCIHTLLASKEARPDLEWTLLDHLGLIGGGKPFLLVHRKNHGTLVKPKHKLIESYTDIKFAIRECEKHAGRMIVVINRRHPVYGWYPHGPNVVGSLFRYVRRIPSGEYYIKVFQEKVV